MRRLLLGTAAVFVASGLALAQTPGGGNSSNHVGSNAASAQTSSTVGTHSGKLSDNTIKSELHAKGYTDVSHIHHHGNKVTATAKKNGTKVRVIMNAQTGQVTAR